jgi:hypothetical protein
MNGEQDNEAKVATPSLADEAVEVSFKMLEAGLKARAPRFNDIKKNEDMAAGITGPALKGRNNVPFDSIVMGGFLDTLLANTDEPVDVRFGRTREQDKLAADKVTAAWNREMGPNRCALEDKVLDTKNLAAVSGRGFMKLFVESAPQFGVDLSVCDHWDMVTEYKGGADLDKHLYKFQMNIFRDASELKFGADHGFYDKTQVRLLVNRYKDTSLFKKNSELLAEKASRWQAFGLESGIDSYVGTLLYRLTEGVIRFKGRWYYILFSAETRTWIRFQPLEEVFAHAKEFPGRGAWVSYATHRHPFLFWSKAPADDVRPIGYTMKKVVNLTLDNLEKRNWDMTAYNPKIFTDPGQLLYRQDGLVRANIKNGEDISKGIFKFQTPDTTSITINLTQWLDNFLGQKSGITPDSQGSSNQDKVGIYYGNIEQLSKRMRLNNKMYRKMYADLGTIFDYGLYEHLREPYAVKLIGIQGARWEEEITRDDTDRDFAITVTSGLEEDEKDAKLRAEREKSLTSIETNPLLFKKINPNWLLRQRLKNSGYTDEQVREALDVNADGDEEVMANAAQAIQDCLEGKEYIALYRGATGGFIQKILDFAADKFPLIPDTEIAKLRPSQQKRYYEDMKKFDRLVEYAKAHLPLVEQNMKNQFLAASAAGMFNPAPEGTPVAPANGTIPGANPGLPVQ